MPENMNDMNEMPTDETPPIPNPPIPNPPIPNPPIPNPPIPNPAIRCDERWGRPVVKAIEQATKHGGPALLRLTSAHCRRMTGIEAVPLTFLGVPCDPVTSMMHLLCDDGARIFIASPWF